MKDVTWTGRAASGLAAVRFEAASLLGYSQIADFVFSFARNVEYELVFPLPFVEFVGGRPRRAHRHFAAVLTWATEVPSQGTSQATSQALRGLSC